MRTFIAILFLLVNLVAYNTPVWAQSNDGKGSTVETPPDTGDEDEEEDIPLVLIKNLEGTGYSLFVPTPYASLCNKTVSVDLSELSGSFTVSIIRLSSGMDVYTQPCVGGVEIDLSMQEKGEYLIEIVSDRQGWQGEFCI